MESLHALNILDTGPEAVFDALTRLASTLMDMPISAVSLVDKDRQWFKSTTGLAIAETPRRLSFCAHAILRPDQVTVVPDAHADPRFSDNDLVLEENGLRFYAGAPIHDGQGRPMGTLCVVDRKPRQLSEKQVETLRDLAVCASAALQLHGAGRRLQELSLTDSLTGLANRRALHEELRRLVTASAMPAAALIMVDMDAFNRINARWGRASGDEALREVSRRLKKVLRAGDLVARNMGDDFVMVCHGIEKPSEALCIARRLQKTIGEPAFEYEGKRLPLQVSFGFALMPMDGRDPEGLLALAGEDLDHRRRQADSGGGLDRHPAPAPRVREIVPDRQMLHRAVVPEGD